MNISGIRPFTGFYDYNTIKNAAVKNETVPQAAQEIKEEQLPAQESAKAEESRSEKPKFGSYDYAQLYRPEVRGELKGAESDIRSLDMDKAISDMRKDQVLQQYQFFVGEKLHTGAIEENFDL